MRIHSMTFVLVLTVLWCTRIFAQNQWIPQNSGTSHYLTGMSFLDSMEGWVVGGGEAGPSQVILHTTDGGATWLPQPPGSDHILYDVFFVDALTGWAVGLYGVILHTTDGGATWNNQISGDDHNLFSVYFLDAMNGWVGGDWSTLLRTTNGGETWEQRSITSYRAIGNFEFVDENIGWMTGNGGDIFRTTNGGATWDRQNSGTMQALRGSNFIDSMNGWVVGGNWGAGQGGIILHTTNGGDTWTEQNSGAPNNLVDVVFTDATTGWIVGGYPYDDESIILQTTDAGATWNVENNGMTRGFTRVHFADATTGWVIGSDGTILHTGSGDDPVAHWPFNGNANDESGNGNDGTVHGATLCDDRFDNPNSAYSFDGVDDYVGVGDTHILRMCDAMSMMAWIDPHHDQNTLYGIVVNKEGEYEFARYIDESIQWTFANSNPGWHWSNSYYYASPNEWIFIAVTYERGLVTIYVNGEPVQTYNGSGSIGDINTDLNEFRIGGRQWPDENNSFRGKIDDIRIYNRALSEEEIVDLYYETPEISAVGDEGILPDLPNKFALIGNYPNPFNPSTTIRYTLSEETNVSIKVCSMLGEHVSTLVDETQMAGYRQVVWDGSNDLGQKVASGIYIYRMTAGEYVETKRMMLVK